MKTKQDFFELDKISVNQAVYDFNQYKIALKREDLLHPTISGNKFRKLKYNLAEAVRESYTVFLTFGGAFSNHLAAVAALGKRFNFKTIGVVRGEEWQQKWKESPTLVFCKGQGMEFHFISRTDYRLKEKSNGVQKRLASSDKIYVLPEGGTNSLAIKGCKEILSEEDHQFEVICCSVGTGGTLAGLIEGAQPHQKVLGFAALKNKDLENEIKHFTTKDNWEIIHDYTFGGYAKVKPELIAFMNAFYQQHQISLDPIYNGKMLFGIFDLIKQNKWPWGKKILGIHSGGLQGIQGMNFQLQKKGWPLIQPL